MNPREFLTMNESLLWKCRECGETAFDFEEMKRHVESSHQEEDSSGIQLGLKEVQKV